MPSIVAIHDPEPEANPANAGTARAGSYPVEAGVPLPKAKKGRSKYPWSQLEVGESFFVPNRRSNSFYVPAKKQGDLLGRTFTVRPATRNDKDGSVETGTRVWRVE